MQKIRIAALSLFVLWSALTPVKAQEADQIAGLLIGASDWFLLERELPSLKQDMTSDMMRHLAAAMTDLHFNRPDDALQNIAILLEEHQEELGFENVAGMIYFMADILWKKGEYGDAATLLDSFLESVSPYVEPGELSAYEGLSALLSGLKDLPPAYVEKARADVVLPLITRELGRGRSISVEGILDGQPLEFIFDTGAGMSGVSKAVADRLGLRIVYDSLNIVGAGEALGEFGFADSIYLGGMVYRNPVLVVFRETPHDTIASMDAVIGLDFFRQCGEFRLYPKQGTVVFPFEQTPLPATGRNLMIADMQPYIEIRSEGERLIFHLDTGNVKADLHYPYYENHRERIMADGEKTEVFGGGFAGTFLREAYIMPEFRFTIGDTEVVLENIEAYCEPLLQAQGSEDGAFGYSLLEAIEELRVNFDEMFVQVNGNALARHINPE